MNNELKTVRKEMTAGDLKGIIDLPNYDDNRRVEVTVTPAEEQTELSAEELKKVVQSLVGAIPYTDKSLHELRMERLEKKYEIAG
ncbi:MAG: hypothetical protein IJQ85_06050 [Selenomonadaceae bacterium]|nr:hypothetical protein [Selenomonadaceae bacterium]